MLIECDRCVMRDIACPDWCGHGAAVRAGAGRRAWRGGTPGAEVLAGRPDDPAAAAARGPAEGILSLVRLLDDLR